MSRSDITVSRFLKQAIVVPDLTQAKEGAPSKISEILQNSMRESSGQLDQVKFKLLFDACQQIAKNLHKEVNKEGGELSHTVFKRYIKELKGLGLKGQSAVDVIKEIIVMARHKRTVSIYFAQYFHNEHYTNAIKKFIAADPSTINLIPELNQPETTLIPELNQSENRNNLPINQNKLLVDALVLTYVAEVYAEDNKDNILTKELTTDVWQTIKSLLASDNHTFSEDIVYIIKACLALNSGLKASNLTAKSTLADMTEKRSLCITTLNKNPAGINLNNLKNSDFTTGGVNKNYYEGVLRAENSTAEKDFDKEAVLQSYINDNAPNLNDYVSLQKKIEPDSLPDTLDKTKEYAIVDVYDGAYVGQELDKYVAKIKAAGNLSVEDRGKIKSIFFQNIDLLRVFYKSGIQHKDLHRRNLLVHEVGDTVILKAIDFGKAEFGGNLSGFPDIDYIFLRRALHPLETLKRNARGNHNPKQDKHDSLHKLAALLYPDCESEIHTVLTTMGNKLKSLLSSCGQPMQPELIDLVFEEHIKFLQKYFNQLEPLKSESTLQSQPSQSPNLILN